MSQEPLQFDRAEYGEKKAETACAACGQRLWGTYYQVGDQLACEKCKTEVELQKNQGSGLGRFLRATLFGTAGGAAGAAVWYGVRAATNYEIGIIAIAVGFLVGMGVRKGSHGLGGWLYQTLAIFLTYAAIVSTYVPDIIQGLKQHEKESQKATASPAEATAASPAATATAEETESSGGGVVVFVVMAVVVALVAFAAPFLMGFENIMGIVIIAIGLYEAWKLNRRVPLEITGPFRVGEAPPSAPQGA